MIYIVAGGPGDGKSYYATLWALNELLRKNKSKHKKKVFTNFPVIHKPKKKLLRKQKKPISSYIWKPEYVYENIYNSIVFVDESYQDYNCKDSKNFDADTQVFFSQQRHNDNDLVMLSPNPARINIIIREMANLIIQVRGHLNIIGHPLYFTTEQFLTIEDYNSRSSVVNTVYKKELYFFRKKVAKSYDTHQFRKTGVEFEPALWYDEETGNVRE